MRLLVIEDEKRLARNLAELLRRQGYTVDVSSDGVSGYDNASTDLYDLILLDAMLPGMDGFTLLRKLRAGGHAVPVLMLTARSDLSDRVQGLDCGADYYLTKPFEPEELLACVRSLLRRGGGDARTDDAITFGDLRPRGAGPPAKGGKEHQARDTEGGNPMKKQNWTRYVAMGVALLMAIVMILGLIIPYIGL